MADINFKVDTVGKAFIIDPNPPDNKTIPLEDMFIYVKLSAYPRSRVTYNGTDLSGADQFLNFGVEDEVNFISTKIRYDENGKLNPKEQKTFATTDWTNISSFSDTTSSGLLEGFGIKSINIKYNASLVPQVDISFTDVRGSALFDTLSNGSDINSPYAIFFRMPYPVFRLSVKGFYGQKVDYCLHMINWTSNFDNSSGSFEINANFLGYQQAILNDLVLGNIIGVVNTDKGRNNLKDIFNRRRKKEDKPEIIDINPYKIDNFITNISKLPFESQQIKSNLDSFKEFELLKQKIGVLKQIQTLIGTPIIKESLNDSNKNKTYLEFPNNKNIIAGSSISNDGTQLSETNDYLVIRDFLILKPVKQNAFKKFIINLNDAMLKYSELVNDENKNKSTSSKLYLVGDRDLIESFGDLKSENNWETTYVSNFCKDENKKVKLRKITDIFDGFVNEKSSISLTGNALKLREDLNNNFSISDFSSQRQNNSGKGLLRTVFNDQQDEALLIDFRVQRSLLEANIRDLNSKLKEKFDELNDELNKELIKNLEEKSNFSPKMKDSFEILMNNSQAMIKTIRDITELSEKTNPKIRNSYLRSIKTDIPNSTLSNNQYSVAFPSVYDNDTNEEIYIGSKTDIDKSSFPEIDFIEEVYKNFVNKKTKIQSLTYDSEVSSAPNYNKFFPINPMDYDDNPYFELGGITTEEKIIEFLVNTFLTRVCVLKNYSNFSDDFISDISKYAKYDSIDAKNVIYNQNTKSVIKNILNTFTQDKIKEVIGKISKKITFDGNNINIPNDLLSIGNYKITFDYKNDDSLFVDLNKDAIINTKQIFEEIISDNEYIKKVIDKKDVENVTKYNGNNIKTTCLKETLLISSDNKFDELTYEDVNPNGKYINKTNFENLNNESTGGSSVGGTTATGGDTVGTCNFETNLVDSELYTKQNNNFARSFLCLSTLPFKNIKEGFLDILFDGNYKNSRVVEIPELYLYYIGSLLWRYETDKVDFNISIDSNCSYNNFNSPKDEYLSKFGAKKIDKKIESELINLPKSVKTFFIGKFKDWTNDNFKDTFDGDFEELFRKIVEEEESEEVKKSRTEITNLIQKKINFVIYNSNIFKEDRSNQLVVNFNDLITFVNTFNSNFGEQELSEENINVENKYEEGDNDIKLSIYKYFKNVNDKWVSDTEYGFNICGGNNLTTDLMDYFKFIDRGWNDIGDKVVLDLKTFVNSTSNLDISVYNLISKVLRDNGFLFQILPNYINYRTIEGVRKIFSPQTTIENNNSSGPIFCCVYAEGNSKHLDIDERVNLFVKDGFSIGSDSSVTPSKITDNNNNVTDINGDNFSLVAFKVAFGSQNQSFFKNVNLNQQEHKETAEYFKALADLIDKRGGTQRSYKGTNLLQLFSTRSYSCTVESMGCMGIQPLMYFDLQNVPFFNGAYLITSVDHSITPNTMSTTFKGLRQSKFVIPIVDKITTSLKIDLTDGIDIPTVPFVPNESDTSIGVLFPDEKFDFETNFTVDNFSKIGVTNTLITQDLLDEFKEILKTEDINTNAQVSMFIANVLTQSNFLNKKTYEWTLGATQPNKIKGNTLYYERIDELVNQPNLIGTVFTAETDEKIYYTYQPIFSATTNVNTDLIGQFISYTPKDNTSKLTENTGNKYLNTLTGDGYFFRPFGLLYIIGRKQYYDYTKDIRNTISQRNEIEKKGETEEDEKISYIESFNVATWVWKNIKETNLSSFELINKLNKINQGKGTVFAKTVEISQQIDGKNNIKDSFIKFEKVLNFFVKGFGDETKLIDYFSG